MLDHAQHTKRDTYKLFEAECFVPGHWDNQFAY